MSDKPPIGSGQRIDDDVDPMTYRQLPEGDLGSEVDKDQSIDKFEFLSGKSIFRFPFTITSLKWGTVLGSLFGLHTYFKKGKVSDAFYWFCMGTVLTGFPICISIKKFEREQLDQAEETQLMREYFIKKLKTDKAITDDELMSKIELSHQVQSMRNQKLNEINEDNEMFEEFESKLNKTSPKSQ